MKRLLSTVLAVVVLLIAIAIGSQNDTQINVNYLLAQTTMSVSTFIAIMLGSGILIGVLLILPSYLGLRLQLAQAKKKSSTPPVQTS